MKKEADREKQREHEAQREAKKLKEFLEDYDDEKDDAKYYKGRELQRRLTAREREADEDARDQQREKEELEELRQRIQAEGHTDPSAEYERVRELGSTRAECGGGGRLGLRVHRNVVIWPPEWYIWFGITSHYREMYKCPLEYGFMNCEYCPVITW